jgi:DNA-binding transcriptional LysR family regulator
MLRGLQFEELVRDAICLAVPPGHPFARLRSISVERVAREPLVAYSRRDYPEYHEYLARLFAKVKGRPHIVEEHEGGASMVAAVEAGYGLALTTQSLACSVGARLRLIPLSPAQEPLVVGAAWSREGLTAAAERFLRCARQIPAQPALRRAKAPASAG